MASVAKREWTYKGVKRTAWVVRWKVGKTHPSKQFERKHEADAYRRKVEREIEDGRHVAPADTMSVEKVTVEFLRWQEDRVRDGRIGDRWLEAMVDAVRLSINPVLGHKKLSEVTAADVTHLYSVACREHGLSPFTAKLRVKVLGAVMDFGRRRGHCKSCDPYKDGMSELRGIAHKPVRTFPLDEIRRLFRVTNSLQRKHNDSYEIRAAHRPFLYRKCFVGLAAIGGMRFGEISALTLGSIDFERGMIHVAHNMTDQDVMKSPKTKAGVRSFAAPAALLEMVKEWVDLYYMPNDRQLIFRNRDGGYQCRTSFRLGNWHVLLKWAGLFDQKDMLRFHALRHFAASWMIENGMGLADVAKHLGHAKFDMTLRTYTHSVSVDSERRAAMEKMTARLAVPEYARIAHETVTL